MKEPIMLDPRKRADWQLEQAGSMMLAYIWCYQVKAESRPPLSTRRVARPLWDRAMKCLTASNNWHEDYQRTILHATEKAYIEFNRPLVMPYEFETLSESILAKLSGFYARQAA